MYTYKGAEIKMAQDKVNSSETTQLGIHSVKNLLGSEEQLSLFSEHDVKFSEEYGVKLEGKIDRFGIDLTDIQARVMEGILRGLSETNYKGNLAPREIESVIEEKFDGKLPKSYENVKQIPRLRVSQAELLKWSGVDRSSIATIQRTLEALSDLGTKQYCFYYDRLAYDSNHKPKKNKNGDWQMEEVFCVDTLFTVKEVREGQTGKLSYYEISPSSIFLDQRESYFMLVPYNWREEVRELVGKKKASSYTFRFLMFLRYQYEMKRRYKKQKPYQIKWSPEEIAKSIKMPSSVYKRKKKRCLEILDDAYEVAKQLGYLVDYKREEFIDVLTLNENKYYSPTNSSDKAISEAIGRIGSRGEAILPHEVLKCFYDVKSTLDPNVSMPQGEKLSKELVEIENLLKKRSKTQILSLVEWAFSEKFWCTRINTPAKLRKNFDEAWIEYEVTKNNDPKMRKAKNKALAKSVEKALFPKVQVSALSEYIEFPHGPTSTVIEYKSKSFIQELREYIKKASAVDRNIPSDLVDSCL